jgi:GTP-binding protein
MGNAHYKSSTNQAPKYATPGFPGQTIDVWLRLKLIADVGLLGIPNAGKSTFLARTTSARPKIADYPFTTLRPQLGVVHQDGMEFVVADIPGLIAGAAEGAGLGTRFLGHIERCKVLLHLIDGTDEDVTKNYRLIRKELGKYDESLLDRHEIIALNKADAMSPEDIKAKVQKLKRASKGHILVISGVSGAGIPELLRALNAVVRGEHIESADDDTTDAGWAPETN